MLAVLTHRGWWGVLAAGIDVQGQGVCEADIGY